MSIISSAVSKLTKPIVRAFSRYSSRYLRPLAGPFKRLVSASGRKLATAATKAKILAKSSKVFGQKLASVKTAKNVFKYTAFSVGATLAVGGLVGYGAYRFIKSLVGGAANGNGDNLRFNRSRIPTITPPIAKLRDPGGLGTIAQVRAKKEAQYQMTNLDAKLSSIKADKIATIKVRNRLKKHHDTVPDRLREIHAKSNSIEDQNEAIIKLLNRQNKIQKDELNLKTEESQLEEVKLRADLLKHTELYKSIRKLSAANSNANADAAKDFSDAHRQALAYDTAAKAKAYSKTLAESKSTSLMKWALLGGMVFGINSIIKRLGGIGELVNAGSNMVGDMLRNTGEMLGILHRDENTVLSLDESGDKAEVSKSEPKSSSNELTQDDFEDKDEAAKAGVNTTYESSGVNKTLAGAYLANDVYKGYQLAKYAGRAHEISKAGKAAYEASKAASLAMGRTTKITEYLANKARKEAEEKLIAKYGGNAANVAKVGEEVAEKSGGWLSRGWNALKEGAGKVATKAKALANKYAVGPLLKGMKWAAQKFLKVLGPKLGPKVAKVMATFFTKLIGYSGKLAKAGAKKIPGVGLIFGLFDAAMRGFRDGDWEGALLSALSGIASTVPGIGTAVSIAIDGISMYRDFKMEDQAEKESKDADKVMQQAKKEGKYKPGEKGNIYNEVIRKFNDTNSAYQQKLKSSILKKLFEVDKKAREEHWSQLELMVKRNAALEGSGIHYDLISKSLRGVESYEDKAKGAKGGPRFTWMPHTLSDVINFGDEPTHNYIQPGNSIPVGNSPFGTGLTSISSNFLESDPKSGKQHVGVDFTARPHVNVHHPYDGVVVNKNKKWVAIKNPDGTTSVYWHVGSDLKPGIRVKAGEVIGKTLSPKEDGTISQSHIHYEVRKNYDKNDDKATSGYPINPLISLAGDANNAKKPRLGAKGGPNTSTFNADRAAQTLVNNCIGTHGACGAAVRRAVESGFGAGRDAWRGRFGVNAKDFGPELKRLGFEQVPMDEHYVPQKGDIFIQRNYPGGSNAGHISMYNGNSWQADYTQTDIWGGAGYRQYKNGALLRFTGRVNHNPIVFSGGLVQSGFEKASGMNNGDAPGSSPGSLSTITDLIQSLSNTFSEYGTDSTFQKIFTNGDKAKGIQQEYSPKAKNKIKKMVSPEVTVNVTGGDTTNNIKNTTNINLHDNGSNDYMNAYSSI